MVTLWGGGEGLVKSVIALSFTTNFMSKIVSSVEGGSVNCQKLRHLICG